MTPYIGHWIAQNGLEVLYEADSPYDVVRWLRKNGLRARVWRVPATPEEAGSMLPILRHFVVTFRAADFELEIEPVRR